MSLLDEELELVQCWMTEKPSTLFGRPFDLSQDTRPAAAWFLREMDSFLHWAQERLDAEAQGL